MSKVIKNVGNFLGSWAFLIGVVLALIIGIYVGIVGKDIDTALVANVMAAAAVVGILVGLFNVGDREVTPFLLSGVVLILASVFGSGVTNYMPERLALVWSATLGAILAIFVPATIIVAVKNVFGLAKN